ncbi:MAG: Protein of unknown function (DUF2510)/Domain of unknown function [Pseudonocardiales bacterium]|nr:Protein of unknown function (DUF2510)/Domain of unknown function [Pseudonocardiales bacterium]
MQPAWYPDPYEPGWLRWWDGYAWTTALWPAGTAHSANLVADRMEAEKLAGPTRIALAFGALIYLGQFVAISLTAHHVGHVYTDYFSELSRWDGRASTQPPQPDVGRSQVWATYLGGLLLLPAELLFMMWLQRAATFARRAGLPARRDPMWAILGFIIPVVNFWYPYQVARDIFPAGHPGRRLVAQWWTLWLALPVVAVLLYVTAYFSTAVAVGLAIAGGVVAGVAAVKARAVVTAAKIVQADLIGQ